jgi:hypothetical protein
MSKPFPILNSEVERKVVLKDGSAQVAILSPIASVTHQLV